MEGQVDFKLTLLIQSPDWSILIAARRWKCFAVVTP